MTASASDAPAQAHLSLNVFKRQLLKDWSASARVRYTTNNDSLVCLNSTKRKQSLSVEQPESKERGCFGSLG